MVIIIVCTDPGAVSFIQPVTRSLDCVVITLEKNISYFTHIPNSKLVIIDPTLDLDMLVEDTVNRFPDAQFLIGSTYSYSFEKALLKLSETVEINLTYYLDHFSNLQRRFNVSDTKQVLPRKIIVIDESLILKISKLYDTTNIKFLKLRHPRFIENDILMRDYYPVITKHNKKILYVSEIIKGDDLYYGDLNFDEFKVFEHINEIGIRNNLELYVKLHPLEKRNKYPELHHNNKIIDKDIKQIVGNYKAIIGINSMLLNEILEYRSGVFFYQPDTMKQDALNNTYPDLVCRNKEDLERAILKNEVKFFSKNKDNVKSSYKNILSFLKC